MSFTKSDKKLCAFYEHKLGHSAELATQNMRCVFGTEGLSQATVGRWLKEFKQESYTAKKPPQTRPKKKLEIDLLEELLRREPRSSSRDLASKIGCSHTAISRTLNQLGYRSKRDILVPHELEPKHLKARVDACQKLLSMHRSNAWLDSIITCDEKWVTFSNNALGRRWLKPGQRRGEVGRKKLTKKKVMITVWWDVFGVIYWEALPDSTTVNQHRYSRPLDRVKKAYDETRPKTKQIYLLHDNAKPHTAELVQKKLEKFNWLPLTHPPYSPDLAPSDYYLFLSLSNSLRNRKFETREDAVNYIEEYFSSKPQEFFRKGIEKLTNRWREVISNQGQYILNY